MTGWRLGVDIGGTFTDIVCIDEAGRVLTKKISSSVGDYARAILDGLAELCAESDLAPGAVAEVVHGTTVGSNAILERKGARTGLITTKGFRDVLEIRNLRMPRLYDLHWDKPPPLVPRYLRVEVAERMTARGEVETPLARADAEAAVDRLVAEGVEVIAVCLLNCFANAAHERLIGAVIEDRAPGLAFCLSSDVLPQIKEYERTSTTVINAYVLPVIRGYLAELRARLDRAGVSAPLLLMQSNGGLMSDAAAGARPCMIIESGPAGGVIGALALARRLGLDDVITFDMGGTTAKASLIEGGRATRSQEYSVGGGIMIGSRLMTGAGYLLKTPAIDLAEVGAGGGSLVWIDPGGSLQVGPESAGADPGPVAYGLGGTEPTVTDANLLLGYLNPEHLVGGALILDRARAKTVFAERIARPLGLTLERAAYGAHLIAAARMMRAIKAVSSERGRDARAFTLVAFGGSGPVFAAGLAEALGIARVIVPPLPGLFSSFGLLAADRAHHATRTLARVLSDIDPAQLTRAYDALALEAQAELRAEDLDDARIDIARSADMHYKGQIYELTVPVPDGAFAAAGIAALEDAFGAEHARTYGHRAGAGEPVELVNMHVTARAVTGRAPMPDHLTPLRLEAEAGGTRRAYFGEAGWLETPVLRRSEVGESRPGPAIVEEYDATCLIPPGWSARLDPHGCLVLTR